MRLESLLAVTGGRLLNDPFVTHFDNLATSLKNVARGSLFIAKTEEEIAPALEKGAYGIMTEFSPTLLDEEVAWITVPSISDTLPKLLRLWLIENPRKFYAVSSTVLAFMNQMNYDHAVLVLQGGIDTMSGAILESAPSQMLLCSDRTFMDRLGISADRFDIPALGAKIVSERLFETSAVINGHYYERLPVAPCTFADFIEALSVFEHLGTHYTLKHLHHISAFDPVFLDAFGNEISYGSGERVVILSDTTESCNCVNSMERLRWVPRRIYLPTQIKFECDIKISIERYDTIQSLIGTLRDTLKKRGYTLIVGMTRERFFDAMNRYGAVTQPYSTKGLF